MKNKLFLLLGLMVLVVGVVGFCRGDEKTVTRATA